MIDPRGPFCREHVGKVYTIKQIKAMRNGQSSFSDVMKFRGGIGCRPYMAAPATMIFPIA